MTELKIGGNSVGKIMYNGQEFGGATKLEPGTILYLSGQDVRPYSYKLNDPHSTVKITFPNAGKHWEGLKKIRIYYNESSSNYKQDFDVNFIDKPTYGGSGKYTIQRERGLTDGADKLIVTIGKYYTDLFLVVVVE